MTRRVTGWMLAALAAATVLLLAATGASAQAQAGGGALAGTVSNGTAWALPIGAGITVTLHIYDDQAEVETRQATTDAAGRYAFDGLSTDAARSYEAEAFYLGIGYSSGAPLSFEDGATALTADVTVYETTGDAGQIAIDSGHLIAESLGPVLRVSELYMFGNRGDRTYVGGLGADGQASTVRIPLPAGAVGVAFGENDAPDRYIQGEGELRDTTPVRPGQETMLVFFSYHLTVENGAVHLERRYDYDVALLQVLLAQPGLTLSGSQLAPGEPQTFQDTQYALYTAGALAAGSPLAFDLGVSATAQPGAAGGAAAGSAPHDSQAAVGTIGFVLAGLALAGALGYGLAARPRPAKQAAVPDADPRARRLIAEVADLDEAFECGRVDEETYRHQRAAKVEALRAL